VTRFTGAGVILQLKVQSSMELPTAHLLSIVTILSCPIIMIAKDLSFDFYW
jgi:hypothetical protein